MGGLDKSAARRYYGKMILSATLSKPTGKVEEILGKKYERVKIRFKGASDSPYFAEFFTEKQSFHKNFSQAELEEFLSANIGASFKNCVERTEDKEITFLANKRGEVRRLEKTINPQSDEGTPVKSFGPKAALSCKAANTDREKNYIIKEGAQVPFLQALGVMTSAGKVVAAKYDKFRQVNRFLETLDDVLPAVLQAWSQAQEGGQGVDAAAPLQVLDFGSGKSYLTFAVQYFLQAKNIPCQITGVDLKEDVIKSCSDLAARLKIQNINFVCGDIAKYSGKNPDIVITLHACDIATDYALKFAIEKNAKAILSVPCCQKEINSQLGKSSNELFAPLLKYGILRERFSALMTDAVRAQLLEARGYKVQVLEFIDMEGTPKNLMIRAVLKGGAAAQAAEQASEQAARAKDLLAAFGVKQTLAELLAGDTVSC